MLYYRIYFGRPQSFVSSWSPGVSESDRTLKLFDAVRQWTNLPTAISVSPKQWHAAFDEFTNGYSVRYLSQKYRPNKFPLTVSVPKYWKYLAKPSFSHRSSHQVQVTRLPNHWWLCCCSITIDDCSLNFVFALSSSNTYLSLCKYKRQKRRFDRASHARNIYRKAFIPQFSVPSVLKSGTAK